jgi:hypothetical protein
VVSAPAGAGCDPLTPWANGDVGAVAAAGSVCYSNGAFTVEASGADIWGASDEFHYVYQTLTGDGEIIARVVSQENTTGWAKAGVMMRNTLSGNSATVHIGMNPNPNFNGISYSMQHREFAGQTMTVSGNNLGPVGVGSYPYYVRLVREGNTFTGYASATNGNWTLLGTRTISMNSTIYVGLATTSVRDGQLGTSVYDNVSVFQGSAAGSVAKSPDFPLDSETDALSSGTLPVVNTEDLFEVYPNPTSGILNLNLSGYMGQAADVFIMNTANQLVWQRRFESNHGSEETIDLGTLQDGMYFVVVQSAVRRDVQQVVLVR